MFGVRIWIIICAKDKTIVRSSIISYSYILTVANTWYTNQDVNNRIFLHYDVGSTW